MADRNILKTAKRNRIRMRVRKRITGTAERPRLSVFRSLSHIYAQLIDDEAGRTVVAVSSLSKAVRGEKGEGGKAGIGKRVGLELARIAKERGIESVVFDRSGYKFHGRVQAIAEGAREGGLKF